MKSVGPSVYLKVTGAVSFNLCNPSLLLRGTRRRAIRCRHARGASRVFIETTRGRRHLGEKDELGS